MGHDNPSLRSALQVPIVAGSDKNVDAWNDQLAIGPCWGPELKPPETRAPDAIATKTPSSDSNAPESPPPPALHRMFAVGASQ